MSKYITIILCALQSLKGGRRDLGMRGIMTKVPMIIDAMIKFSDADWLLWMDDDTWINPSKYNLILI